MRLDKHSFTLLYLYTWWLANCQRVTLLALRLPFIRHENLPAGGFAVADSASFALLKLSCVFHLFFWTIISSPRRYFFKLFMSHLSPSTDMHYCLVEGMVYDQIQTSSLLLHDDIATIDVMKENMSDCYGTRVTTTLCCHHSAWAEWAWW